MGTRSTQPAMLAKSTERTGSVAVQREKQRVLMDLGGPSSGAFGKALSKSNPFLVRELGRRPPKEQVWS